MSKFPVDAPLAKVIRTLELLGFIVLGERKHIVMVRYNPDATTMPLTMPNHSKIKSSTLRSICAQSGISRDEFLYYYEQS
ncbi:MAG: type II toxin-antitoxin system HicA family toxin [Spirirestis rafaelensis WJT71-NPBG6]|jgi:predicted RNA binding protein YcfA (HicA-like mRNA interferase family)|nr:type II toxin-antitoxin system HicA family toxin [Spirirestis rafaelensis WJT71-NPBG6]